MVRIMNWLKGYLHIRISGISAERFINLCGFKNILLWNICKIENDYEMFISIEAFRLLRPIVYKTKIKVAILHKCGLPFFISKIGKRKIFLMCFMFTIFFWFISGNFIWKIQIDGNYYISDEQLSDYLKNRGIHVGMLKRSLDIEDVEKDLRIKFHNIIWTSGKIENTCFFLDIKESEPEIKSMETEIEIQFDMVAQTDGIIHSMIVREGVPKVKQGERVSKGDILIEGCVPIYNDDQTLKDVMRVKADGDIMIRHQITGEESLPYTYTKKEYTGRQHTIGYLNVFGKDIRLGWENKYNKKDSINTIYHPEIFKELSLPVYWGKLQYREYQNVECKYTENQMKEIFKEKLMNFIDRLSEKGVQIIEKDVKIVKEDSVWKMYMVFDVAQQAIEIKPIEQTGTTEILE